MRLAKTSPGRSSTGRRLTCASAAAVTMLVAPGPIERGRRHHAAAETRLGVGDRGMRHRLLVVGAEGRQLVAHLIERLADAGDIAVAEDRPDAAEERQRSRRRSRSSAAPGSGSAPAPSSGEWSCSSCFPPAALMPLSGRARQARPRSAFRSARPCRRSPPRRSCVPASHSSAASAKIVRPTAKPLTIGALAVAAKAASSSCCGASRPSSTMPRHHGSFAGDDRLDLLPGGGRCLRLELPPVGLDAERVEFFEGARNGVVGRAAPCLPAMISISSSRPTLRAASNSVRSFCLLLGLQLGRIVGMIEAQALDAVVDRPFDELRADVLAELEAQRARARQLDRPAEPGKRMAREFEHRLAADISRRSACRSRGGRRRPAPRP